MLGSVQRQSVARAFCLELPRGVLSRRVLHVSATKLPFFRWLLWLIQPHCAAITGTMRTLVIVFMLALISIGFEIYSDAALTSAHISHAAPDPVSTAIGHGLKRG
jgi:hypothetical protein